MLTETMALSLCISLFLEGNTIYLPTIFVYFLLCLFQSAPHVEGELGGGGFIGRLGFGLVIEPRVFFGFKCCGLGSECGNHTEPRVRAQ